VFGHALPLTGGGDGEADIAFGHLSDRIGREWVWMIANLGFVICCLALIGLRSTPTAMLLYVMVLAQGTLGYGLTSVMEPIPAEIFEGRHHGSIFGTVMLAAILGGAAGPWITGILYDATGTYSIAFCIAAGCSLISILAIWLAAPRKVRAVAGRAGKLADRRGRLRYGSPEVGVVAEEDARAAGFELREAIE
jgi:MFS family permease